MYEDVPARLRAMSEQQLAAEERLANEVLTQFVLKDLGATHNEDPEELAAELRLLETQLALNLTVRDSTFEGELARSRARGEEVTPQVEELVRSMVHGTFAKGIDRVHSQLLRCREKLASS